LIKLRFYVQPETKNDLFSVNGTSTLKQSINQRCSSQPISWLSTEKLNLTQYKQTCNRNKIYYNTK